MYFACENRSWPLNLSHLFPELHVEKWENQGCSPFPQRSCWTQERCWANCRSPWDRSFCSSYLSVSVSEQTDFNFVFASTVRRFYPGWFAHVSLPSWSVILEKRGSDFCFSLILFVCLFLQGYFWLFGFFSFFFFFSKQEIPLWAHQFGCLPTSFSLS